MLKNISFKFLETGFDIFYNMGPNVFMKRNDLLLLMESFQSSILSYTTSWAHYGCFLIALFFSFIYNALKLPSPSNTDHCLLEIEILLVSLFSVISCCHRLLGLVFISLRNHFSFHYIRLLLVPGQTKC